MALRDLRAFVSRHGLWIVSLALIAVCIGIIATQNGLNYGYDGGNYLSYAENIRAGHGLSQRVSGFQSTQLVSWIIAWPPLYPMILALSGSVFAWARFLDVLMLTASVVLTYLIGVRVIGRSWAAAAAALVYLSIPTVLSEVFSTPLSETVFTVLALAIVLLMTQLRLGEPARSLRPALYAAALAAFAMLTRYLGLTLVVGMTLYSLLWALTLRSRRRWLPVLFFALSTIPLGLYALYLKGLTGSFTGAQETDAYLKLSHIPESLHQMSLQLLHGGIFLGTLFGLRTNWWIVAVVALVLIGIALAAWRHRALLRPAFNSADILLVVYIVTYIGGFWVLGARSHYIVADWRHYVPIYPAILVLIFHLLATLRINRILISAVVVLYCVSGVAALPRTLEGGYWNTTPWRTDPIVAQLPSLIPAGTLVHSNEIGYLALHLGIETSIRVFGGEAGFQEYQCSQLTYPTEFSTAAFTLFDSNMLRGMTPEAAKTYFTTWASPCGTVENVVSDSFAMVMVVHLNGR
ncbi:MAG: glycosyltransferase family 39 protein [Chloroflexota bacterium]